jgi:oxaloacetate decarboxylase beta subunit
MKNLKKIIFFVFLAVSITLCVMFVINNGFSLKEAVVAVSIIGGADGPTTIYISAKLSTKLFLLFAIAINLIVCLILLITKKIIEYKRKKTINSKYFILFILIFNIILLLVFRFVF